MAGLAEHPDGPGEDPYPSNFDTEVMKRLEERSGARRVSFDQCIMGGPAQKTARVTSTVKFAAAEALWCDGAHTHTHELSYG